MSIFLVNNNDNSDNLLNEAFEYLKGCLEDTYEVDEDLLEACLDVVNENTDTLSVDDYNTVMESIDYLAEAYTKKANDHKWYKHINNKYFTNTGDKGINDLGNRMERKERLIDNKNYRGELSDDDADRLYEKLDDKHEKAEDKLKKYHDNKLERKVRNRERKINRQEKFGKISSKKANELRDKLTDYFDKREPNYYNHN